MTTYIKLPRLFWIPTILIGEYVMVQIILDRDGFIPQVKGHCQIWLQAPSNIWEVWVKWPWNDLEWGLGPIGSFLDWISVSRDFNIGFLGWFIAIHTFEALFAFKLAWDKNLNLFSCLFWCLQTLVFGLTSFEVKAGLNWYHYLPDFTE